MRQWYARSFWAQTAPQTPRRPAFCWDRLSSAAGGSDSNMSHCSQRRLSAKICLGPPGSFMRQERESCASVGRTEVTIEVIRWGFAWAKLSSPICDLSSTCWGTPIRASLCRMRAAGDVWAVAWGEAWSPPSMAAMRRRKRRARVSERSR